MVFVASQELASFMFRGKMYAHLEDLGHYRALTFMTKPQSYHEPTQTFTLMACLSSNINKIGIYWRGVSGSWSPGTVVEERPSSLGTDFERSSWLQNHSAPVCGNREMLSMFDMMHSHGLGVLKIVATCRDNGVRSVYHSGALLDLVAHAYRGVYLEISPHLTLELSIHLYQIYLSASGCSKVFLSVSDWRSDEQVLMSCPMYIRVRIILSGEATHIREVYERGPTFNFKQLPKGQYKRLFASVARKQVELWSVASAQQ